MLIFALLDVRQKAKVRMDPGIHWDDVLKSVACMKNHNCSVSESF